MGSNGGASAGLQALHRPPPAIVVTRERVIAPPERHIDVGSEKLVDYFKGSFGATLAPAVPALFQLIDGISTNDFAALRRRLQDDYEYFGAAAEARSGVETKPAAELDTQELRFLHDFAQLMEASQYRMLTKGEWEAAQAEDFLFTLPCDVKWDAMDTQMLRRYWAAYPEGRSLVPEETRDRILVFQRGAEKANMEGLYVMLKINLIVSMWVLQPIFKLFVALMKLLRIKKFDDAHAPKGLAATADEDPAAKAKLEAAARAERHPASTSIERRTFARVFPTGLSVVKQLFKKVRLQEACFRDVVVLYRKAVPDKPAPASEVDIIKEADPKFMQRNIELKQFRGIPIADLEMIMPEKKVFVPPKVFLEMAITLIGGLVAMFGAMLSGGKDGKVGAVDMTRAWTGLSLMGGRAMQVYTSAYSQKQLIENTMGKLLYERTVGSGTTVLNSLVDSVCRQRVREIFVCYCVLLNSQKPLSAEELDEACEAFLGREFGCRIDFCCEEALPAIMKWGLAAEGAGGKLTAVPLPEALKKLDSVFDSLYEFKGSTKDVLQEAASSASAALSAAASKGGVTLGRSLTSQRMPAVTVTPVPGSPKPAGSDGKHKGGVKGVFRRISRALS